MTGCRTQRAELVERREGRARVGRLVAERPVELGGVPDRFVDRQPQVGRVDHEVVAAGLDARCLHVLGQQAGQFGELGVEVPAGAGEVLPAAPGRWGKRAHGRERPGTAVDMDGGELRVQPHPLLGGRRAARVGVELVLQHLHQVRVDVVDPVGGEQPLGQLAEPTDPLVLGDRERVDVVGGDPHGVGVGRFGRERDRIARLSTRLTRAVATACSASRAAASGVRAMPAAKPHAPSWITRTASPRSSLSVDESTRASRSASAATRMRSRRKSACSAPSSAARPSAASARDRSGRARNEGSRSGMPSIYVTIREPLRRDPTGAINRRAGRRSTPS